MNNIIELIENNLSQESGQKFVEQEIGLLFSEIANTNKIDDAELLFKNLEDIQFALAKAIFKNGIEVTTFLRDFVYDFDRIDDIEVKLNLYNKIKSKDVR